MAKAKKIHVVKDNSTGEEMLVKASNGKAAIGVLVSDRFDSSVASTEDIVRIVNAGGKIVEEIEAPAAGPTLFTSTPIPAGLEMEDPMITGASQDLPFDAEPVQQDTYLEGISDKGATDEKKGGLNISHAAKAADLSV